MELDKEARKVYDAMSGNYHHARTKEATKGWFYNEYLEMPTTLKMLGSVKGKKILDIGCGRGLYARIPKRRGAHIKGVDISEGMLKIARAEVPGVTFVRGTAGKLPFPSGSFGVVLAALMLEYLPSHDKVLNEIKRVLKRNGTFVFSIGNPVIETQRKIVYKGRKFRDVREIRGCDPL